MIFVKSDFSRIVSTMKTYLMANDGQKIAINLWYLTDIPMIRDEILNTHASKLASKFDVIALDFPFKVVKNLHRYLIGTPVEFDNINDYISFIVLGDSLHITTAGFYELIDAFNINTFATKNNDFLYILRILLRVNVINCTDIMIIIAKYNRQITDLLTRQELTKFTSWINLRLMCSK